MTASKTCSKCRVEKPAEEFYANPGAADGRRGDCKRCVLQARRVQKSGIGKRGPAYLPRSPSFESLSGLALAAPTEQWPPPIRDSDVLEPVAVRQGSRWVRVELRRAVLWGQSVLVDREGRVFCDHCADLVDVGELGRPDHRHRVGLFRDRRSRSALGALTDEDWDQADRPVPWGFSW